MPFVKGQSGNPGGRAKIKLEDGRTLADLAREHTPAAVKALAKIMKNGESEAAIVAASTAILDRAWGRPRQDIGVEVTDNEGAATLLEAARRRAADAAKPPAQTKH